MDIQEIFITELGNCKKVAKEDIIRLGEEYGLVLKPREAKAKVIKKIVEAGYYERLFDTFQEFIYIPSWTVGDWYKMNSQQIDELHRIGAIKETPQQKEFYSRASKQDYTANTYPLSVLDYSKEELQEAYNQAFKEGWYKIRLETETEEEVQKLINEFKKVFVVSEVVDNYERRNQGFNSYFQVQPLNNSQYEQNRFLAEIQKLKNEIEKVKQDKAQRIAEIQERYFKIFGVNSIFVLQDIKAEYEAMKNSTSNINNSRGAGRKPRFTDEQKGSIREQRKQGKTIKELAQAFNCSIGIIHKLINETE